VKKLWVRRLTEIRARSAQRVRTKNWKTSTMLDPALFGVNYSVRSVILIVAEHGTS
jgi:hypothetical protein